VADSGGQGADRGAEGVTVVTPDVVQRLTPKGRSGALKTVRVSSAFDRPGDSDWEDFHEVAPPPFKRSRHLWDR
jgi:hypothetical protein